MLGDPKWGRKDVFFFYYFIYLFKFSALVTEPKTSNMVGKLPGLIKLPKIVLN